MKKAPQPTAEPSTHSSSWVRKKPTTIKTGSFLKNAIKDPIVEKIVLPEREAEETLMVSINTIDRHITPPEYYFPMPSVTNPQVSLYGAISAQQTSFTPQFNSNKDDLSFPTKDKKEKLKKYKKTKK